MMGLFHSFKFPPVSARKQVPTKTCILQNFLSQQWNWHYSQVVLRWKADSKHWNKKNRSHFHCLRASSNRQPTALSEREPLLRFYGSISIRANLQKKRRNFRKMQKVTMISIVVGEWPAFTKSFWYQNFARAMLVWNFHLAFLETRISPMSSDG